MNETTSRQRNGKSVVLPCLPQPADTDLFPAVACLTSDSRKYTGYLFPYLGEIIGSTPVLLLITTMVENARALGTR